MKAQVNTRSTRHKDFKLPENNRAAEQYNDASSEDLHLVKAIYFLSDEFI